MRGRRPRTSGWTSQAAGAPAAVTMKRSLPRSLDDVSGMRAARWFRESTAGQWDNFGPDAQREQQDRAIDKYGLLDAGLEWSVASSGWTSAWRTATWDAMVSAAKAGAFDVLVVGYVSRFLRNLKQTLIAVEDHLHAAGVVVLFADERLLSSDPGPGTSSSARRTRPRHTAGSCRSASARDTRRSADASAYRAATRRRSASSGRASRRSCASTRSGRQSSCRRTPSRRPAPPTGRSRPRRVSPRPTWGSC